MLDIHYICPIIDQGDCAEKSKLAYTDKLTKEIANKLRGNVEFRKVETNQYKLSQAADLICTVEAIAQKTVLTKSESEFFHSKRDFTKNIYKNIAKKKL